MTIKFRIAGAAARLTPACLAANAVWPSLLLSTVSVQAAVPLLKSQNPCAYNYNGGDSCLEFNSATLPPKIVRALDFNAPGAGHALVSVNGSGVCSNVSGAVGVADLSTQIVNKPKAVADYKGDGGNRFAFTLPIDDPATILSGNGVFNLASQRLFAIGAAGTQHYSLNIAVNRIDTDVYCFVSSVALTVLFLP